MTRKVGEVHQKLRDAQHRIEMMRLREDEPDESTEDDAFDDSCTICGRDGGNHFFYHVRPDNRVICDRCMDAMPVRPEVASFF
jgi:hypothetical protein